MSQTKVSAISNVTQILIKWFLSEHGIHAGSSPIVEGTKNGSSTLNPNTPVEHVPSDSPNNTIAGNKNFH